MRLRHKLMSLLGGDPVEYSPHKFDPDWRVAPGETLRDVMEAREMTPAALGTESGLSLAAIQALLDGTALLTPNMADCLELGTGIKALFWLNLEEQYRRPVA